MKRELIERITRLEFNTGDARVPDNLDAVYDRWVQLGLGEIEPRTDYRGFPWNETGVAWSYRRMMEDLHAGRKAVGCEFERDVLQRYRARLEAGLIQPFTFPDEIDALEDGR